MKFSKLENQGPFILNEAMPDPMVAFLGWNSNFEKKSAWGLVIDNSYINYILPTTLLYVYVLPSIPTLFMYRRTVATDILHNLEVV